MKARKISIEITDNYNNSGFRNFIKYLLSSEEQFEVFIISNNNSTSYINGVAQQFGIDSKHTIICNFSNDKLQAIIDNKINIHFDNIQSFIILVDSSTDGYGILVSGLQDKYLLEPKYTSDFNIIMKQLDKEDSEKI